MGELLNIATNEANSLSTQAQELDSVVNTLQAIGEDLGAANSEPSIETSIEKLNIIVSSLKSASESLTSAGSALISKAQEVEEEEARIAAEIAAALEAEKNAQPIEEIP